VALWTFDPGLPLLLVLVDVQRELDRLAAIPTAQLVGGHEVLLAFADAEGAPRLNRPDPRRLAVSSERAVSVGTAGAVLAGDLAIPSGASAIILFAHGSGSSRKSPRTRFVAERLQRAELATLLFDLLTPDEERIDAVDAHLRFDIKLLARRLVAATDWVVAQEMRGMRLGYFGASTGAAALVAAAERPNVVGAVVSRGGRPDLAEEASLAFERRRSFIVGGFDAEVLRLNRESEPSLTRQSTCARNACDRSRQT